MTRHRRPSPRTRARLAWTTPGGESIERVIVVCEGIPDALVAAEAGLRAVGVLGTWAADRTAAQELATLATASGWQMVVCFDADEAGRAGADRLRRQLDECSTKPVTVSPPRSHDLTTWARVDSGWREALVNVAGDSRLFARLTRLPM
jgi:hypothetical protein